MTLKIGRGAAAPPFIVMDVIAAANARQATLPAGAPHVIRMEVGQPGTGAPAGAVAAAQAALRSGAPLGYTEAFGRISLRERIVEHIRSWYGLDVPVARVWRALTDPALIRIWSGEEAEIDPRKGGLYRVGKRNVDLREAHIDIFDVNRRLRLIYLSGSHWPRGAPHIAACWLASLLPHSTAIEGRACQRESCCTTSSRAAAANCASSTG